MTVGVCVIPIKWNFPVGISIYLNKLTNSSAHQQNVVLFRIKKMCTILVRKSKMIIFAKVNVTLWS